MAIMWKSLSVPVCETRKLTGHHYTTSNFLIKFLGGRNGNATTGKEGIVVKLYPIHDDLHFSFLLDHKTDVAVFISLSFFGHNGKIFHFDKSKSRDKLNRISRPKDHVRIFTSNIKSQIWHRQKRNLIWRCSSRVYTTSRAFRDLNRVLAPSRCVPVFVPVTQKEAKRKWQTWERNDDILCVSQESSGRKKKAKHKTGS